MNDDLVQAGLELIRLCENELEECTRLVNDVANGRLAFEALSGRSRGDLISIAAKSGHVDLLEEMYKRRWHQTHPDAFERSGYPKPPSPVQVHLGNAMSLIDEVKETLPEGVYIKFADEMRIAYNST